MIVHVLAFNGPAGNSNPPDDTYQVLAGAHCWTRSWRRERYGWWGTWLHQIDRDYVELYLRALGARDRFRDDREFSIRTAR